MNEITAKWKVYNEKGRYQLHKLNDDGTQGESVGPAYEKREDALKYQRALYKRVPDAKAEAIDETNAMNSANLMLGAIHFEADELNPRILHFKDVVLARPEVNKNRDGVDEVGIQELAASIALMPIDVNHKIDKNIGTFTAGRVGENGELRVDGIIWLDRCDEMGVDPNDVLAGDYGLSIEADALSAECDKCHKVFSNANEYCEHIRIQGNDMGIRAKLRHGANRLMHGLRAIGGAFTRKPAATGTGWDSFSAMSFVASHQDVVMDDETVALEVIAEVLPATEVAPESDPNKEQAEMADKPDEKETPEEKKMETPEDEKKEEMEKEKMKAEYEAMKADMTAKLEAMTAEKAALESKLQAAETQLVEANNKIVASDQTIRGYRVSELRSKLVGSVMDEEKFTANVDKYLTWDAEAIELISTGSKAKPESSKMNAAVEESTVVYKLFRS